MGDAGARVVTTVGNRRRGRGEPAIAAMTSRGSPSARPATAMGKLGRKRPVAKETILVKSLPVKTRAGENEAGETMSARVFDRVARADSRQRTTWQS